MLRHPYLFARQVELGIQLLGKGALTARDRELAVLRIAWLCQAPYNGASMCTSPKVQASPVKKSNVSLKVQRLLAGSVIQIWIGEFPFFTTKRFIQRAMSLQPVFI